MFKQVLGFFGRVLAVKNNLVTLATYLERADDDGVKGVTDKADGKPDALNLCEDLQEWAMTAFYFGKTHLLDLERIAARAKALEKHIQTGDK